MLCSVTLAFSIITNRIWNPILYMGCNPCGTAWFGGDEERFIWLVAGLGGWLGWTIPLLACVVAAASPGCVAPVNFSTRRHAAGVTSGRMARRAMRREKLSEFNGKIRTRHPRLRAGWVPTKLQSRRPTHPTSCTGVDDTGIATWDCFGGLVEMPAMSRIAERGVRLSQFHTTAFARRPGVVAHRTQRHHRRDGDHRGVHRRFPNCHGRIPFDTALLSEVLANVATTPTAWASGT